MSSAVESPSTVQLRQVRTDDLDLLNNIYADRTCTGDHQWFGQFPTITSIEEFVGGSANGGRFMVDVEGEAIGTVQWQVRHWGPVQTSWCWEISYLILPDHRRRGWATAAVSQLVEHLFDHTRAHRVQAVVDVANSVSVKVLTKAGFEQEGVVKAAQWREGRWHDQVILALIRPVLEEG